MSIPDLNDFFGRIAPEDNRLYRHTIEGPDDMPAHIRSALTRDAAFDPGDRGRWHSGRGRACTYSSIARMRTAVASLSMRSGNKSGIQSSVFRRILDLRFRV